MVDEDKTIPADLVFEALRETETEDEYLEYIGLKHSVPDEIPDDKMICSHCGGTGIVTETHLVGDGQWHTETRVEEERSICQCDDGLIDDPEAQRDE